jgi:hypothetical protein
MILRAGAPMLVLGRRLLPWTPAGYDRGAALPRLAGGEATVITPRPLVDILSREWHGLVPLLHPSAHADAPARAR